MRKGCLLFLIILILAITTSACAINGVKNKSGSSIDSSKASQQVAQQDKALTNTQTQSPSEKQLTQVIVKRGNYTFSFDAPLRLRGLGVVADVQDLLWIAPRGGAGIQPEVEEVESKKLDKVLESGDKMRDSFCLIRLIYEPYKPKQGMNDLAHKDLVIYTNPDSVSDAYLGVQDPENQTKWYLYRLPGYGQWLKKEVDLLLRIYAGL